MLYFNYDLFSRLWTETNCLVRMQVLMQIWIRTIWWLLILAFREITYTLICYTFTSIIKKATFKQQIIYGLDTRPGEVLMKKRSKTSAKRIAKMKFEKDLGPKAQLDSAEIFRSTKTAFLKGYLY